MQTATEHLIYKIHNGEPLGFDSRILRYLWFFDNPEIGGRLLAKKKGKWSLVEIYAYLLTLNRSFEGARRARRYLRTIETRFPAAFTELGVWGRALIIENNSITMRSDLNAVNAQLQTCDSEILRAYLLRSKAFQVSRRQKFDAEPKLFLNHSEDTELVKEVRKLFTQARGLFKKFSTFEVARTNIYQARREPSLEAAIERAKKGKDQATRCNSAHYIQAAKDELTRRNSQRAMIEENKAHLAKILQPIERAITLPELWNATKDAFFSDVLLQSVPHISFLKKNLEGTVELVQNANFHNKTDRRAKETIDREHNLGLDYLVKLPVEVDYHQAEAILRPAKESLRRILRPQENSWSREIGLTKESKIKFYSIRYDTICDILQNIITYTFHNIVIYILGETGTGKEFISYFIHNNSKLTAKNKKPMIIWQASENASNADWNMTRTPLFGYVKNAFQGATKDTKGKIEEADNSTLLLDEAGELDSQLQPLFLRFLDKGEFERVGDTNNIRKANVRTILATNRNIMEMVENKTFRNDLYERRNFVFTLPPLREVPEQIEPLAVQLYKGAIARIHSEDSDLIQYNSLLDKSALDFIKSYHWPGNVRSLKNYLEMMAVHSISKEKKYKLVDEVLAKEMLSIYLNADGIKSANTFSPQQNEKPNENSLITSVLTPEELKKEIHEILKKVFKERVNSRAHKQLFPEINSVEISHVLSGQRLLKPEKFRYLISKLKDFDYVSSELFEKLIKNYEAYKGVKLFSGGVG